MLAKAIGVSSVRLRHFLAELERGGRVAKLGDGVYVTGQDLAAWRDEVQAYLREHQRITVAQFRDHVGISRNLAVPILERLDQERITIRVGDSRVAGLRATRRTTA